MTKAPGLKPGVPLLAPPPGDPPPWMAKRPAGIRAIQRTFKRSDIDREALRRFDRPVYFALGALSKKKRAAVPWRQRGWLVIQLRQRGASVLSLSSATLSTRTCQALRGPSILAGHA
jgi:hypothetical protein